MEIPPLGCVNIHASLLPKYRGAAPIQYAVINGEKESGVTTMMMAEGLDTGDMLDKEVVVLDEKETGGSLHDKLSRVGAQLIVKTLSKLEKKTAVRTPQDDSEASYVGMITKSMGEIDWSMDASAIERLVRGMNPWPSAYTGWKGKMLKVWEGEVTETEYEGEFGQVAGLEGGNCGEDREGRIGASLGAGTGEEGYGCGGVFAGEFGGGRGGF